MAQFDSTHGIAVVGARVGRGDARVGGGDGFEFAHGVEAFDADGEHEVAVGTIADVRTDGDGIGVELTLEGGERGVGRKTDDRGEDRLRERGLDGVGDVHGEEVWKVGKAGLVIEEIVNVLKTILQIRH